MTATSSGRHSGWEREAAVIASFVVIIGLAPLYGSTGTLAILTRGLVFLALAFAWNLVGGFLGELSLLHMVFWGVGAYGIAVTVNNGWPLVPYLAIFIVAGGLLGALGSGLIGAFRLRGLLYIAIFTLVLQQIAFELLSNLGLLGGSEGLVVNSPSVLAATRLYLLLVLLILIVGMVNVCVAHSTLGRQWLAVKDDRQAAAAVGINIERSRLMAYALSAALCAAAGAYQAYYNSYASPGVSLDTSFLILATLAVFAGGAGTALGPLAGTIIIAGLGDIATAVSTSISMSVYAQLLGFLVALVLLRFILPRIPHLDLINAVMRWLGRLTGRAKNEVKASGRPKAASWRASGVHAVIDARRDARSLTGTTADTDARLEVRNVGKHFGALRVLEGVSFQVRAGQVIGIIGPNGAGKSTMCNILTGIETASSGAIFLDGAHITRMPAHRRTGLGFGRSFQAPRLFPSLTLLGNLMLATTMDRETALAALHAIGITDPDARYGDDSDFFVRRLVEVVRAAAMGSRLLILDEPLAGLTPEQQDIVLDLARGRAEMGAAVVIIEHSIPELAAAVDSLIVLDKAHVIASGSPQEVLHNEAVVTAYLGVPMEVTAS